jgi:hypothetical protein
VRGHKLAERLGQSLGRLEVHLGASVPGQVREPPAALARPPGRESLEAEPVGGQPRDGQRRRHRGRSGQRRHPDALLRGRGDEPVAGIADPRGSRVGDQQDVLARLQVIEQPGGALRLDRVIVRNQAGPQLDVQARREPAHPAGVLGRDDGGPGEFGRQPG